MMVILLGVEDAEVRLGEVQTAAPEGGDGRESHAARCWVSRIYMTSAIVRRCPGSTSHPVW